MTGKEKLLYLISHYKSGNYSTDDFCNLYINAFVHENESNDFTNEEWEQFEQLMHIASRYSPYVEDIVKYPKVYHAETDIVNAVELAYSILVLKEDI